MNPVLGTVFAAMAFAVLTSCADLAVTGWSQDAATDLVTVSYTLSDEPMVVTLDVLTNGVSIGARNLAQVTGDVNRLVTPGSAVRQIFWRPDRAWDFADRVNVQVKAVGWPVSNPPDYMAVQLSAGTATAENVRYYTSEDALPGGIGDGRWRTDFLLMRHIRAAGQSFVMGSPLTEQYRLATLNDQKGAHERYGHDVKDAGCLPETPHRVSFSKDFYLAVFKPTLAQMDFIKGTLTNACTWADAQYMTRGISWNALRGQGTASDAAPSADSYLGKLRALTGLAFDLPTEAEWEFACRAGTYTPFNDGRFPPADYYWTKSGNNFPTRDVIICCNHTGWDSTTNYRPGAYPPNNWGLYDMNGCWAEWCRDSVDGEPFATEPVTDPLGTSTAKGWKSHRGGVRSLWAPQARTAARVGVYPDYTNEMSFRLACPAVAVQ